MDNPGNQWDAINPTFRRFYSLLEAVWRARSGSKVAEREGFEPSIRFCRILTFQASAFDHSATAPHSLEGRPCRQARAAGQPCSFGTPAPMPAAMRRFGT